MAGLPGDAFGLDHPSMLVYGLHECQAPALRQDSAFDEHRTTISDKVRIQSNDPIPGDIGANNCGDVDGRSIHFISALWLENLLRTGYRDAFDSQSLVRRKIGHLFEFDPQFP